MILRRMFLDTSDILLLISLVILLILSSFFSCAETALTTCNLFRMRTRAEEGDKKAKKVIKITDKKAKMLSAILIGNNIVNISASSIATILAIKFFGDMGAGIATGVLTLLVLIFGEISPKTLATIKADSISRIVAPVIGFSKRLRTSRRPRNSLARFRGTLTKDDLAPIIATQAAFSRIDEGMWK